MDFSGSFFSLIKYFQIGRFMKSVINGQSPETHEINISVPQGFLFFLLYINDISKNIPRSLVNIYTDYAIL